MSSFYFLGWMAEKSSQIVYAVEFFIFLFFYLFERA